MNYLIIITIFIIIILSIFIIRYFLRKEVILISKVTEGCCQQVFSSSSIPIASINGGLEYTFSFWIYISGWDHRYNNEKVVLYWKGRNIRDEIFVSDRVIGKCLERSKQKQEKMKKSMIGKYGGLKITLAPKDNNLIITQTLINGESEEIVIKNIPMQKWLNIIVMMKLRNLDVFLNGILYANKYLKGVPLYGAHKLIINGEGGYDGLINQLVYHNKALTYPEIKKIWNQGIKEF